MITINSLALYCKKNWIRAIVSALGALLVAFLVVGSASMNRYQGFGLYSLHPAIAVVMFIGVSVCACVFIYIVSGWNQERGQALPVQASAQQGLSLDCACAPSFWHLMKRYALPITCIIAFAWSLCLIIHYPGTITFDTAAQMLQIDGLSPWRANHPPATTVLYGAFFLLGDALGSRNIGLFLFCTLQVIATAFAFATGFVYLKFLGVTRRILAVLLVFCLVIPLFPLAAECMTKDYTLALIWVFWFIGFIEAVRTKGRIAQRNSYCVLMFIISLLMILSKKPSSYLIIVSTLVFLLYARRSGLRFVATSVLSVLVLSLIHISEPTRQVR